MEIKLHNDSVVQLKGKEVKLLFTFLENLPKGSSEVDRVVGAVANQSKVLSQPGEYEYVSYGLMALEKREEPANIANVFKLDIDGVNLLFWQGTEVALDREDWQTLGQIDVLVINLKQDLNQLDEIMKKATPAVILGIDSADETKAEKITGMAPQASDKKFKFNKKDFATEDISTTFYLLTE